MTTAADTASHSGAKDSLLHLVVDHATTRDVWSGQGVIRLRNVNSGHHEKRTDSVPHIVLLVKLGVRSGPKIYLVLLKLIESQL